MKRDSRSPQAYIDSVGDDLKRLLLAVRELILEASPESEEYIEYGMLAYGDLANLAAQKHYVSLYVSPAALEQTKVEYPNLNCGKSCLRMKSLDQLDPDAVRSVLRVAVDLPPDQRSC